MHIEEVSIFPNSWLFTVFAFQVDSIEGPASVLCKVVIYWFIVLISSSTEEAFLIVLGVSWIWGWFFASTLLFCLLQVRPQFSKLCVEPVCKTSTMSVYCSIMSGVVGSAR